MVESVGFSVLVFAGASQLAAIEILDNGGVVAVAVLSALMINLRFLMYSASLAPHMAEARVGSRLLVAYLLTDQAYALSLGRFTGREPIAEPSIRLRYYLGVALTFWLTWQTATVVGAIGGGSIPDSIPLEFAIPLAFLALLVPAVTDRPTVAAALVGGIGTVVALELGAGDLSLVLGASAGIIAGTVVGSRYGSSTLDELGPPGDGGR